MYVGIVLRGPRGFRRKLNKNKPAHFSINCAAADKGRRTLGSWIRGQAF